MNKLFRLICSIPIILIALYFIPFLGIVLILFRFYTHREKNVYILPIVVTIVGFLVYLPKAIFSLFDKLKINIDISFLNNIVSSNFYTTFMPYGKRLITIGIIFLIISFIYKNMILKLKNMAGTKAKDYIEKYEQEKREIKEKNDLKIREQREAIKNTHLVHCPNCGADNTIVGATGHCKFCRQELSYKE